MDINNIIIWLILLLIVVIYYNKSYFTNVFSIPIYDKTNEVNKGGYNMADLLNLPTYWFEWWPRNPHKDDEWYNAYKEACKQFPTSIVANYGKLRTDENEVMPNNTKICQATDIYIDLNKDKLKSNKVYNLIDDKDALFVHLRSGDKLSAETEYLEKINELSKYYKRVIILAGIHSDSRVNDVEKSKKILSDDLNKIIKNNIELDLDHADVHVSIMRKCKNLLVHKGGFSILGTIVFSGDNLYATNLLETKDSSEIENNKILKII